MPNIATPVLSANGQRAVPVPAQPANPPSQADIAKAFLFKHDLVDVYRRNESPLIMKDFVDGCNYSTQMALLAAELHNNLPPPWFQGAIDDLKTTIRADIRRTETSLSLQIGQSTRVAAKLHNKSRTAGIGEPYEIVNFVDGPTQSQRPWVSSER